MGNQTSQSSVQSLKQLKNYEEVSRVQDGVIFRQRNSVEGQQTVEYFILKEHNYHSHETFQMNFKKYQQSIALNARGQSNTLSIRQVMKEEIQHFCSNTYKIYTLYEFPELTLKDEIDVRAKENKFFQECEIIAILQTCVLALEEIKSIISFSTKYIFISPDGIIKVTHDDLVDENYRHVITPQTYYAPEKITNFMVESISQVALKKEIVFSMGMTLLQACILEQVYDVYDYNLQSINEKTIADKIESLTERYSNEMIELITNMLEVNPNRRISMLEVQRALNKFDQMEQQNLNDQQIVNQQNQQQQLESKCDRFFGHDPNALPRIKQSSESNEEPSVPNLLSQQNSSRMSVNNQRNLQSKGQTSESFYKNIDQSMEYYKTTCHPVRKSSQSSNIYDQTAQFSQAQLPSAVNDNLFTDPRLMQMIRKDLEQISKSRTSRVTMSEHDNGNNSWVNTSQNTSQNVQIPGNIDYHISRSYNQVNGQSTTNGYMTLNNCPQVQSLAASVAFESSEKKTYVYQESEVKSHPDDKFGSQNVSQMNISVALSSKNFNSNKKQQLDTNDNPTVRYPLREVPQNQNPASSLSQVQAEIKAAMMKKKQANLIYLEEEYEDGVRYEGMSKNGLKQGYGKLIYNDGAYYEGYFHNDSINGKGTLYYRKNFPAYDGEWQDEQFNGYGQLFNEQPQQLQEQFPYHNWNFLNNFWIKYQGQFLHDNKNGHGKIILTSGEYIQGQFSQDMLNGWAKFFKQDGGFIQGRYENNILVELKNQ